MKKTKILGRILPLFIAAGCLQGCDDNSISDIPPVVYQMTLSSSTENIVLTDDNLGSTAVTFTWTQARQLPSEYMITYTTKLDIVGNNFGASTVILTDEETGVFSRSYTGEQINNWAREKWGVPDNTIYTLQFRVVAQWDGGSTFEAPEVQQVEVTVVPPNYTELEFEADYVFIAGSAPGANLQMTQTLEDEYKFAWLGNLNAGELQVLVEFEGKTNYLVPDGGDGTMQDGQPEAIRISETPVSWQIPSAGEYRIVVNMWTAEITIYSPATALQPKVVEWTMDGNLTQTTVTNLWLHGAINGWGDPINCECTVSVADPQVLISKIGRSGTGKFIVYGGSDNNKNNAYCFVPEPTSEEASGAVSVALTLDVPADLSGGSSRGHRDSSFNIPSGTKTVVLDLRNMKITAKSE